MKDEDTIVNLVKKGFFKIDSNGHFWKCYKYSRTLRLIKIRPYIADVKRLDGYIGIRVRRKLNALAHRVVWIVRNGPIPNGLEINHKNGNKTDNRIDNLEVVTKSENLQHSYDILGRWKPKGGLNGRAKLNTSQVKNIRLRFKNGESGRSLGRAFGVSHTTIQDIVAGKLWPDNELPEVMR